MDRYDLVKEAMLNAKENGHDYFSDDLAPGQVADDIMKHCSALEDEDFCEISDCVHIIRLEAKRA